MKATTYSGKTGTIEKARIFCKHGAYYHRFKDGWILADSKGDVVDGYGGKDTTINTRCWGAARIEIPNFKTRKSLIAEILSDGGEML